MESSGIVQRQVNRQRGCWGLAIWWHEARAQSGDVPYGRLDLGLSRSVRSTFHLAIVAFIRPDGRIAHDERGD